MTTKPSTKVSSVSDFAPMSPGELAGVVGGLHGKFAPDQGSYTVGRGDNLTNIARATGQSLDQLLAANPQFTANGRNPNLIYPGDTINFGQQAPASAAAQFPQNSVMQALQSLGQGIGQNFGK